MTPNVKPVTVWLDTWGGAVATHPASAAMTRAMIGMRPERGSRIFMPAIEACIETLRRTGGREAVYSRAGLVMGAKLFGAAVKRREDPRFLRGEGRFIDDVVVPGMLHAAFVRSPHAHALVRKIHTEAAAAAPGVARVFTFADLERWMKPLPLFGAVPAGLAAVVKFDVRQTPQVALCRDRARYVGEIVAMVVADSPERAQDAADLIQDRKST